MCTLLCELYCNTVHACTFFVRIVQMTHFFFPPFCEYMVATFSCKFSIVFFFLQINLFLFITLHIILFLFLAISRLCLLGDAEVEKCTRSLGNFAVLVVYFSSKLYPNTESFLLYCTNFVGLFWFGFATACCVQHVFDRLGHVPRTILYFHIFLSTV